MLPEFEFEVVFSVERSTECSHFGSALTATTDKGEMG